MKIEWILCPFCGSKTRLKIRYDTVLENFPLYCPKCKHETLITVRKLNLSIVHMGQVILHAYFKLLP